MANLDTGWILKYSSAGSAKATAEMTVSNLNDTTARITASGRTFGDTIIQNGIRTTMGHNSAGSTAARSETNTGVLNGGAYVGAVSATWDFPRKETAYNVTVYVQFSGETVGGWLGFYRGSDGYYGPFVAQATLSIPAIPITAPNAATGVTNTRNSDNKNTVSWTNGATSTTKPRSSINIKRQVDGGAFVIFATGIAPSSTSYADTTTQANHSYAYEVESVNSAGSTTSTSSQTTYNTPTAPGTPKAVRASGSAVSVTFDNGGNTQTQTEWQRSTDKMNWTNAVAIIGVAVVSLYDSPGAGSFYYRFRNVRGTLASDWSLPSNEVVTIIAPAAPTLRFPVSGKVVSMVASSVRLEWTHNPIDGSAQTSAQVRISINDGGSWATTTINGADQFFDALMSWPVNTTITWSVRTKGAHTDYGPYSSNRTFIVRQVPQVTITSPISGSTLTNMPLMVTWNYSDSSGTQAEATLSLVNEAGVRVYTERILGATTSIEVSTAEFLPDNNSTYTLLLGVYSTSSLSAETTSILIISYVAPASPIGVIDVNHNLGSVSILAIAGVDPLLPATIAVGIFRRRDDDTLLSLANWVPSGTSVIDPYPPLDVPLTYVIAAYTASGISASSEFKSIINSNFAAYINYGKSYAQIARIALAATWDQTTEHTSEIVETAGLKDEYPLSFYGNAKKNQGTITGQAARSKEVFGDEDDEHIFIPDMKAASLWTGNVVLRLPYEQPIAADVTLSLKTDNPYLSDVSLTWRRVRPYGLVL